MDRIKIFFNKHGSMILAWLIIIGGIIALIQVFNYYAKLRNEAEQELRENSDSNIIQEEELTSSVTGEELSGRQEDQMIIVETFFNNINEKKIEEAYNMLSDECKEELYKDLDSFTQNYVDVIFKGVGITYDIKNWADDTYKVDIFNNSIITGTQGNTIQDYITAVKTDGNETKLNINNYIERIEEDGIEEIDNIKIEVLHVDVYREYKEYTVKVTNRTSDEVAIAEIGKERAIYLVDEKDVEFNWAMNELSERELFFYPGETREVDIKFYSSYVYNNSIEKVVFNNIFKIIELEGGVDFIEYKLEI